MGAAALRGELALVCERSDQRLQACLRGAVAIERGEHRLDLERVSLDRRGDELVLGLEVVVDVPGRDVCLLRDLGQGRALHALLVQEAACARYQALALIAAVVCS